MYKFLTIHLLLLLFINLTGCSSDEKTSITEPETFLPQKVTDQGQVWNKKGKPDEKQQKLLEKYLKKNSTLVENPLIKGIPHLYSNEESQIRFYWFNKIKEQINWIYIEFQENEFNGLNEGLSPMTDFN